MQESVDDRKFWNIMKGIGIICVVVGHSGSWLTPYVYMFHMVLFVFISGYLFNERYVGDFKSFLKKRGKSLYLPTVKYRIAYALLLMFLYYCIFIHQLMAFFHIHFEKLVLLF